MGRGSNPSPVPETINFCANIGILLWHFHFNTFPLEMSSSEGHAITIIMMAGFLRRGSPTLRSLTHYGLRLQNH